MYVHLGFISHMHDQTRGIVIVGVHRATPTSTTILIRGILTDIIQGLDIEVEADPPHRITSIGVEHIPPPIAASSTSSLTGASISDALEPWLQQLADRDVFSGAVGIAKDGEILFAQAYGEANKDFVVPNTLETAFNLGSMNKMFTADSNTGFLVLGAVIEAVTGQDYFTYIRTHLYEPLGMRRTEAYELDRANWNLAVGYDKEFTDTEIRFRNNLFEHVIRGGPAGGGYSTVTDLVRFATALHAARILSPATTELLLTPKPELQSPTYGYGFSVDPARNIVGHGGGFSGISSNLDIFRDSGYVAVVLSNYGRASEPVVAKLQQLILTGTQPTTDI